MTKARPNNKYTTAQVIAAIRDTKGLVTLAAKRLGCTPKTIYNYAARYPTVAEALRVEREAMTDVAELALYNAIQQGQPWAVSLYLKTQGKSRGYTERVEHTGADGGPVATRAEVRHEFDTDAYAAAFAAFYGAPDEPESAHGHGDEQPVGSADTDAEAGVVSDDAGH